MDRIPLNPVRACALEMELAREFSKREWRDAYAIARARWLSEGHKIEKVKGMVSHKPRFTYVE